MARFLQEISHMSRMPGFEELPCSCENGGWRHQKTHIHRHGIEKSGRRHQMSRRDMQICRLRKEFGLSCRSCRYSDTCKEYQERRIKPPPKVPRNPRQYRWTPEEIAICVNPEYSAGEVARMTGRTKASVDHYRQYHGFGRKYNKKDKSE